MAQLKLKLRERWVNVSTGKVIESTITDEIIHIDDDLDFDEMSKYYIGTRVGSSIIDDVRHEVTIDDGSLSKEEMFDFILNNRVTLYPDGSTWTKYHDDGSEEKIVLNYTVAINGHGMSGYDLESAINYYVKEIKK